jgi:hypothetical protein
VANHLAVNNPAVCAGFHIQSSLCHVPPPLSTPLPQVLWVRRVFATYLTVIEDATDPTCLRTRFDLLRSVRGGARGVKEEGFGKGGGGVCMRGVPCHAGW